MTADIATCETCLLEFVQTAAGGHDCERCKAAAEAIYILKSVDIEEYCRMLDIAQDLIDDREDFHKVALAGRGFHPLPTLAPYEELS